ncbi:N-methyl-L-tryptophan oxidase [Robiginitalea sp.]|uniref:N-methyl-L-tryptophan oxidase n=2 Tax=Robiginitalea sp. TaxID=1902411 RepID=UPI003C78862C
MERREFGDSTSGKGPGGQTVAELYAQAHKSMENTSGGSSYDVIVIGVGSMGASACYHLAKRGCRVLGLEQHDIPHELGSHAGQSRIIRKAYGEAIGYVPLLERAYENWRTLESETGSRVFYETGLTYFGPPGSPFLQTVRESAETYRIPLQDLSPEACRRKYPQFALPEHFERLEEPEAGLLTPERSILLLAKQALQQGAVILCGEPVLGWEYQDGGVVVRTPRQTYRAGKLVITAGAWARELLPGLEPRLQVTRQALAWVQPEDWERFTLGTFPCWHLEHEGYHFYGFPIMPEGTFGGPHGLKLALHHPGEAVTDPDTANRSPSKAEEKVLVEFLEKFIPQGYVRTLEMKTCLYTNTPDGHFVVDYLKEYGKDVVLAAGFSGHGFKFVSVIGEVLADLALEGATPFPIGFLRADRFDS